MLMTYRFLIFSAMKKQTKGDALASDVVSENPQKEKGNVAALTDTAAEEKKIRVLLVEDDAFLANIYKTKFEMEGFHVTVAGDGEAGVAEAKKKAPQIILLDILLPKMDGFVALQKLKEDPGTKKIPVILLTNLGQKDDVEKGIELGAADYLIKAHFKPSETVEKVRAVLKHTHKKFA